MYFISILHLAALNSTATATAAAAAMVMVVMSLLYSFIKGGSQTKIVSSNQRIFILNIEE